MLTTIKESITMLTINYFPFTKSNNFHLTKQLTTKDLIETIETFMDFTITRLIKIS